MRWGMQTGIWSGLFTITYPIAPFFETVGRATSRLTAYRLLLHSVMQVIMYVENRISTQVMVYLKLWPYTHTLAYYVGITKHTNEVTHALIWPQSFYSDILTFCVCLRH